MASKDFKVGDLVWAKMKGYPLWPAKIAEPSSDVKAPKSRSHYVYFFGSEDFAWIADGNIRHHSKRILKTLNANIKNKNYHHAIEAFINFSENKSTEKHSSPREENKIQPRKGKDKPSLSGEGNRIQQSLPRKEKVKNEVKKPPCTGVKIIHSGKRVIEKRIFIKRIDKIIRTVSTVRSRSAPNYDHNVPNSMEGGGSACLVSQLQTERALVPTKKIGFIGLGLIGKAIVLNLLKSGHHVTVWNKTPFKADLPRRCGAKIAYSPSEVIFSSDITFCCVSDPDASKSIIFGEKGVLHGLQNAEMLGGEEKCYVEMTSIDPETSQEICEAVTRKQGRYLEAAVCGSSKNAEEGTLLILASGDRQLFTNCKIYFDDMAKTAYFISYEVGYGAKMGLVLSTLSGTVGAAVAEAVMLSRRLNLDNNTLLEVLRNGPLECDSIMDKCTMMLNSGGTNTVVTPLKHIQKDMHLSLQMSNQFCQPMPVTAAANEVYKHARMLKYSDCDVNAVYQALRF